MDFTEEQINRYSRHILLPEVGGKGQKKIAKARILLVGAGGLGSPAALYLAAAGVGTIGLIDSDVVDLTNLQWQILHHTPDVGRPKVLSGKEKIQALNPDVTVSLYEERLTAGNALKIFNDYDVVIDGVDNFTCECDGTGHEGDFCQTKIDHCRSEPCQHGATCFDRFTGYVCQCSPQFAGTNCERETIARVKRRFLF